MSTSASDLHLALDQAVEQDPEADLLAQALRGETLGSQEGLEAALATGLGEEAFLAHLHDLRGGGDGSLGGSVGDESLVDHLHQHAGAGGLPQGPLKVGLSDGPTVDGGNDAAVLGPESGGAGGEQEGETGGGQEGSGQGARGLPRFLQ